MLWRVIEKCRKHDSSGRVSVYSAALDKRGRVITEAGNEYRKSSPIQARFAAKVGMPEKQYLHSELKVLLTAMRKGATISSLVVARTAKDGTVMDGKPCKICSAYIEFVEQLQGSKIDIVYSKGEK